MPSVLALVLKPGPQYQKLSKTTNSSPCLKLLRDGSDT
ncbi:hypothetical protein AB434_3980 [Heyndrickxia coagulans]|uniref:Uncharacterized protein n=1 Tax=Heyndrickxia coagulans TaxID=1398 RepID=A0AAN0T3G5_HEYCO|nr:hypothetical protein SB48_HM08orf01983 [Heyndrickxia coagulans]AKN56385.1 hypothetical protein AB434_3980 [Heyndrickxia coagulans]KYC59505.1 hypothetical protein B4100_2542 [Heyndrickxia coagulans]